MTHAKAKAEVVDVQTHAPEPGGRARVVLRPLRVEDEAIVLTWRNSPAVAQFMYTDHVIASDEHASWLERVLADPTCVYWIIEHEGRGVGVANLVGIDARHSRCSWAFYLMEGMRGRRIGAYVEYLVLSHVFDTLQLNKLCGEVLDFNAHVLAIHERFGFVREGLLRQHIRKGGQFHDVVRISLLRSDWEAGRPKIEAFLRSEGLL